MLLSESVLASESEPRSAPGAMHRARPVQSVLFNDSPRQGQVIEASGENAAACPPGEWSEEDVVLLHWRLLAQLRDLDNPATPLEEKIDTLNWVFTDPDKDAAPFSFVSCLKVVGCSPLSPTAYFGALDPEAIREWIRVHVARWMRSSLERYPAWVREQICANPGRVVRELDRNPQWINEQVRKYAARRELFA